MRQNYTHITIVLDKSGSMSDILTDTIGGYNTFLKGQQVTADSVWDTFSLVQFSNAFNFVYRNAKIKTVPELTTKTFVPSGMTALLDAVGFAIRDLGDHLRSVDEMNRPDKVIFVIITDGKENCSWQFNRAQIFAMIKEQTDSYKWQFVFLGADQNAIEEAGKLGIYAGSSMTYAKDSASVGSTYGSLNAQVNAYKLCRSASVNFSAAERISAVSGVGPGGPAANGVVWATTAAPTSNISSAGNNV